MTFAITVRGAGSGILHTVDGDMTDHLPWETITTRCGREVVAENFFLDLDNYRSTYNSNGKACTQCVSTDKKG